jgi:hypothetical protein
MTLSDFFHAFPMNLTRSSRVFRTRSGVTASSEGARRLAPHASMPRFERRLGVASGQPLGGARPLVRAPTVPDSLFVSQASPAK